MKKQFRILALSLFATMLVFTTTVAPLHAEDLTPLVEDLKRSVNTLVGTVIPDLQQQADTLKDEVKNNAIAHKTLENSTDARLAKIEADLAELKTLFSQVNDLTNRTIALEESSFTPETTVRTRTEDREVFAKGILLSCNAQEVVTGCQAHCSQGGSATYAYPINSKTCRGAEGKNSTPKGTCTLVATCLAVN